MMGRCSCYLLDDRMMCLVQLEDGKMFLLLLDREMSLVLPEEEKMFLLLHAGGGEDVHGPGGGW